MDFSHENLLFFKLFLEIENSISHLLTNTCQHRFLNSATISKTVSKSTIIPKHIVPMFVNLVNTFLTGGIFELNVPSRLKNNLINSLSNNGRPFKKAFNKHFDGVHVHVFDNIIDEVKSGIKDSFVKMNFLRFSNSSYPTSRKRF